MSKRRARFAGIFSAIIMMAFFICGTVFAEIIIGDDMRLDTNPIGSARSDTQKVSADNNGNIYVVWSDSRDLSGLETDSYLNYSTDNGASWQASDIKIPGEMRVEQINSDDSGFVYVAFGVADPSEEDISFPFTAPEVYSVILTVEGPYGSHTIQKTDYVTIASP